LEDKTLHVPSGSSMPAARAAAIKERYIRDVSTLHDNLARVFRLSIPRIIISGTTAPTDGPVTIRYEYDIKTQEQIDILREHIQGVTDYYRKVYPELFRFIY